MTGTVIKTPFLRYWHDLNCSLRHIYHVEATHLEALYAFQRASIDADLGARIVTMRRPALERAEPARAS